MISKENLKDFNVVAKRDSFYKMYVNLNQQVFCLYRCKYICTYIYRRKYWHFTMCAVMKMATIKGLFVVFLRCYLYFLCI